MSIYKLTHKYTTLCDKYFAVETPFNLEEMNYACVYLQLVRYTLPVSLDCCDDDIGESDGVPLLSQFYNMKPIYEPCPFDAEIDFYDNWNEYAARTLDLERINQYAVIDADIKMLEFILAESKRHPFEVPFSGLESKIILEQLISGAPIMPEWDLRDITGKLIAKPYHKTNQRFLITPD